MTGLQINGKSKLLGRLVKWDLGRPATPHENINEFPYVSYLAPPLSNTLFGIGIDRRTGMVSVTWIRLGESEGTVACIYSCWGNWFVCFGI